jgi:hypothetical protein
MVEVYRVGIGWRNVADLLYTTGCSTKHPDCSCANPQWRFDVRAYLDPAGLRNIFTAAKCPGDWRTA